MVLDKFLGNRTRYLKELRRLANNVRALDGQADAGFAAWQQTTKRRERVRRLNRFKRVDAKLQTAFPRFHYKQRVLDEMMLVPENVREKIQASERTIEQLGRQGRSLRPSRR